MRTPSPYQLLQLWERSAGAAPAARALSLLALALPELGEAGAAACSIGARDSLLLDLRERLFGAALSSVTACPACAAAVETSWTAAQLRASVVPPSSSPALALAPATPLVLDAPPLHIRYRLPDTTDLLALAASTDLQQQRQLLLARCIASASIAGAPVAFDAVPASALAALEAAMATADPLADIELALACPACGHRFQLGFDIASFLWTELHGWAQRLLFEVHTLARAYGWSEAAILALSPGRRGLYVAMSAA